jgi:pyruvate-ferredoxin/flavodoxin oxidoreductase
VAFGAKDAQTVKALTEADAFRGPSLIIAYSHCIAHGYDMAHGAAQQKLAVDTGYWPLYRHNPRRGDGEPPLRLDSAAPKGRIADYARNETRFRMVEQQDPARFKDLMALAQKNAQERFALYEHLAHGTTPVEAAASVTTPIQQRKDK